jgi:hypothetical protein
MYLIVAALVFVALLWMSRKNFTGTVVLSLVWPVLLPAGVYFTVKKFVFNLHGPSERYFELEVLGILTVTAVGLVLWRFPGVLHG